MIYDDYISYTNEYRDKYGYNTVVFLQVGDFFELYAVQNDDEQAGADIFRIGELCNLQVTRKNKSLADNSRSNPYMAGFPLPIVQKHVQSLTQNGYTVVIIRQVTPPPNVKREVTEIISPSTNPCTTTADGTFLMTCYFINDDKDNLVHAGLSGIDVTTGQSFSYEAYSSKKDPALALDETYRIVTAYSPKEIVLIGEVPQLIREKILSSLEGQSRSVHQRWNAPLAMFQKCAYQNQVLQKAFPASKTNAGLISYIEACHLERLDIARTSFVYMIQFAYEHNERLIERIQVPQILESKSRLTLEYNSALQLNLIGCMQGDRPLIQLLNRCGTAFGSRTFKERLLSPVTSPHEIQRRHALIDKFPTLDYANSIHKQLCQIQDLERLSRRMILGTFSPLDWYSMHSSLVNASYVSEALDEMSNEWKQLISSYTEVLDLEACSKYVLTDIRGNVFKPKVHQDLDQYSKCFAEAYVEIQRVADSITACDPNGGDACLCRVESNDRDGYYLVITKKRWDTATKSGNLKAASSYETKPLSSSSTILRVTSPDVQRASDCMLEAQRKLSACATMYFKQYVAKWIIEHQDQLTTCVEWLSDIDVACTNAKNAFEFGYVKPTIVNKDTNSYIQCEGLRHPIIERLQPSLDYVGNDLCLGGEQSKYDSLLLYGINSSGKSSFMKAIGLNVIMAQSGMYVACSRMELRPYHHIFTRISGADNIYRGMSSFTVEMTELNNILHRCDEFSLVLGDELCAGTEAVSALAIVSAGIQYLSMRRVSFVFATHLHELVKIPIISSLNRIHIAHMHIDIDPETRAIVYHRKLQNGPGSSVYGLEVCSALGLPSEFLKVANEVRRHVQDVPVDFVNKSPSRYNKSVIMDTCKVCGTRATETHHIRYQCAAHNGAVELGVGVHRESNLVTLCEECHLKEHRGEIKIHGYIQTSNGVELRVEPASATPAKGSDVDQAYLRDVLRCGSTTWKMKTSNGVWKKITDAVAEKKLKALLKASDVDLVHWKMELFDPLI